MEYLKIGKMFLELFWSHSRLMQFWVILELITFESMGRSKESFILRRKKKEKVRMFDFNGMSTRLGLFYAKRLLYVYIYVC